MDGIDKDFKQSIPLTNSANQIRNKILPKHNPQKSESENFKDFINKDINKDINKSLLSNKGYNMYKQVNQINLDTIDSFYTKNNVFIKSIEIVEDIE